MALVNLLVILLLGGIVAQWSQRWPGNWPRRVALVVILVDLGYFLTVLYNLYTPAESQWLLYFQHPWIPRFGISVELAMDGLSLLLVMLTLVLGAIAVVASWNEIDRRPGFFHANLLWTLTGVLGVFLAMDLFLFFLFWEVMLVPMYLLIAIWGHEDKTYASMKFFIFTQVSGLLMLVAIIGLVELHRRTTGVYSFSYFILLNNIIGPTAAGWLLLGFALAFLVKLPAFPLHTWLPDAHTQAPTAGSVILAGILLKTGAYGLIRFALPLFPEAAREFAPAALLLGAAGVLYGAVLAFAQRDFKRLVAYSSISHMGFVLLGIFAWNALAMQGAIMQMIAHGLSTAALFMIAGALQQRLHTRDMQAMGGLWQQLPRMGALAMFFAVASLGLPGLGNFVAEFLVLLGLFQVNPWLTAVAALGLIVAAVYALLMLQRSFQGAPREYDLANQHHQGLTDFGWRELCVMAVMAAGLVWLGLYPHPVLELAGGAELLP